MPGLRLLQGTKKDSPSTLLSTLVWMVRGVADRLKP